MPSMGVFVEPHNALMDKVRAAAEILRAKRDLQSPMPALERLRTVAMIHRLHTHSTPAARPSHLHHSK